tara:strand:- start:11905 stop:12045 length:141 start_codon:yes stop_codon:yes gene_type:complete
MTFCTGRILPVIMALVISIGLASALSACGKKGPLEPPLKKEETKRR